MSLPLSIYFILTCDVVTANSTPGGICDTKATTNDKCDEVVIFSKNIMKVVTNGVDIIVENKNYFVAMIPCRNYCAFILL
jgi:hypothetical protein